MIYKVVSVRTQHDLADVVNSYIEQGWEPIGGVSVYRDYMHQAMIYKETKTKSGKQPVTIDTYIKQCKADGIKPIPKDDKIFEYAKSVGIPDSYLHLAWVEFVELMQEKGKRQKSWTQTFRLYVRNDYLKLWRIGNNGMELTTRGQQAEKKLNARRK